MSKCYIVRRGTYNQNTEQLGIYPIGTNGRPVGNVQILNGVIILNAFVCRENSAITSVTLPPTLLELADYSFYNCSNLMTVNWSEGIITVGDYCFQNCTNLISMTLPNTLQNLYTYAFSGCTSLIVLNLANTLITTISSYLCQNCTNLMTLSLPNNITSIGTSAFNGCTNLVSVNINNVTTIADSAFQSSGLININFNKITSIGTQSFYSCTKLVNVTVTEGLVYTLGSSAFSYCTSLTDDSAHNIMSGTGTGVGLNSNIFSSCASLINVNVKYSWTYMFSSCTNLLTAVITSTLPSGSTGTNVFDGCTKLTQVTYPEGTLNIGNNLFYNCSALSSFTFPASIISIGSSIFYYCTNLKTVTFQSIPTCSYYTNTSSSNLFYYCINLEEVIVPVGWNLSLVIAATTSTTTWTQKLTVIGLVNLISNLADLTGFTSQKLTIGATNLAKLSSAQVLVLTSKNWTVA